jgi:hypothetical protein
MPRNPQEYVAFVARHFSLVDALVRRNARFGSDDEIVAFLQPFEGDDKNVSRLIGRLRDVGILIDLAGEWCVPPFLVDFIKELGERHVLASPKVIQGWVATLEGHVDHLVQLTGAANLDLGASDIDDIRGTLLEIADVFQNIVRTVQDNCERIAAEVAEYRATEDASRLRSRLARLIHLHDEYLDPVIRVVEVGGEFFAVTEKVETSCTRLAVYADERDASLADDARSIRQEVTWLRRVVVRRAEEARRELAPLCEAAARESQIARGVTHVMQSIAQGDWTALSLETHLTITVDKDATNFSDSAISRFMRLALNTADRPPPRIPADVPEQLAIPVTADDLIQKLEITESIDDLLHWVLDSCEEVELGEAVRIFHSILEIRPDRTHHTDVRRDYMRGNLIVDATTWTWRGSENGDVDSNSDNGRPARKARSRVSSA